MSETGVWGLGHGLVNFFDLLEAVFGFIFIFRSTLRLH
jgi:hypothetical protein